MAWAFSLHVFKDASATTPERFATLLGMIAAQADRVAGTTLYAQLQDNNHSISEGAGLWTVGILFPMLAKADVWRKKGQEILEREAKRLIYEDGSFSQKSNNYHRLMLHDYLYAIRIGEVNGYRLEKKAVGCVRKAADFLLAMTDPISGWAPNLGGNDGALIMPLNSCDYNDMRPVVVAVHYLFAHEKLFEQGPWHEDLYWLFGAEAIKTTSREPDVKELEASSGGYYTLRGKESWGMLRCGSYIDRPSHADSLHLDLWRCGRNIAIDPGSYLYYGDSPWDNSLQSTRFHNTISVDGLDQLEKGPRFIWLRWHDARLI
ncbi:MAG: heparinase II/III family protein, partial [Deltaproteobacteria bacterium]|nr:heparinase II/III family protein [Deltaproteobacteria bacterium]